MFQILLLKNFLFFKCSQSFLICFNFPGNKSAEADGEDEGADVHVATSSSLVGAAKLEELPAIVDKKSFKSEFKTFSKKLVSHVESKDPSRVDAVKKVMMDVAKKVLENYKEYEFYTVEEHAFEDNGPILMHKTINKDKDRGDQIGDACELIVFKDIVYQEKCVS